MTSIPFREQVSIVRSLRKRFVNLTEFERRRLIIGPTTFTSFAGLHPYQPFDKVVSGKLGSYTRPRNSERAQRGIDCEERALKCFENSYKYKLMRHNDSLKLPWIRSNDFPLWLATTPDGITLCGKLVEIKRRNTLKKFNSCEIEAYYYVQIQVSMFITGLREALFVEYFEGDNFTSPQIRVRNIEYNPKCVYKNFDVVREKANMLWGLIKNPINDLGFKTPWDNEVDKPGAMVLVL